MNLALFDFDGTITTKDSFYDFMKYICNIHKVLIFKNILMLPVFIAYGFVFIPEGNAKELFLTFFFKGPVGSFMDN